MEEEYLTPKEAGAILRKSADTVRYLIRTEQIAAAKIGGRWFVPRSKLIALLEGGEYAG